MIERVLTNTKMYIQDTFSAEESDRVITYLGGTEAKVCIVQDNRTFEYRDYVVNELKNYRDLIVLDKVFPDPKVQDIMDMVNEAKEKEIDVVIGIGGGSALDSAKAVAMILSNGGDLDDYLGPDATRKIESKKVKLILIPTTAGTGSEVTRFGVYTARSGRKYTLANELLQADLALLVTQLTYTLPPKLTAATGFDALSHALETVWNKNATPVSDVISMDSAVYIMQWLDKAYQSAVTGDREGRREMMMGAAKAGISFNLTGTAAVHALSFILSEEWHIPHGAACAFTLEDVLLLNSKDPKTAIKLTKIARRLFGDGSQVELIDKFYNEILAMKKRMRMPIKFSDLGIEVKEDEIENLFERSFNDPKMKNNIVEAEKDVIYNLLKNKI